MKHAIRLVVILLLLAPVTLAFVGCSGVNRLDFTRWGRAMWQRPDDVIEALDLAPSAKVADVGAGRGYLIPYLADAVGDDGRVYAVEVDGELVSELEERFADAANVVVIEGALDDPGLPDGALDLIVLVNTYHHIEDREDWFGRLRDDLAPGGRVAVIEPDAELNGVLGWFVEEGHASLRADVEHEMAAAGYRKVDSHELLPVQIFEVFAGAP